MERLKIDISKITISLLNKKDKEIINFIINRLSKKWFLSKEEVINTIIKPSLDKDNFYSTFIAKYHNEFVGKTILFIEEKGYLDINNQPWITGVFVKEEFRDNGIGKELIETAKKQAKQHGFKYVYLDTAQSESYYENLGDWEKVGIDYWKEGNKNVTIMKIKL